MRHQRNVAANRKLKAREIDNLPRFGFPNQIFVDVWLSPQLPKEDIPHFLVVVDAVAAVEDKRTRVLAIGEPFREHAQQHRDQVRVILAVFSLVPA